jgi:hypothetical protein
LNKTARLSTNKTKVLKTSQQQGAQTRLIFSSPFYREDEDVYLLKEDDDDKILSWARIE